MKRVKRILDREHENVLIDKNVYEISERNQILGVTEEFYKNLYKQKKTTPAQIKEQLERKVQNINSEEIPDIEEEEIRSDIRTRVVELVDKQYHMLSRRLARSPWQSSSDPGIASELDHAIRNLVNMRPLF
ncbi:hypothetical protein FQA39_LY10554 [Lamprigera yunnana]|nr:hypothetical protein FQA39_LY10554 [Lamprigera yunnana]